jgi:hypothetical protein
MEFITPINQNTIITKKEDPKDYSMSAFWDGFKQENLSMIAARNLLNNADFTPEENYNPSSDPQLNGYESLMHHFYFSQSSAETAATLNKLKRYNEVNKESPWYMIGRLTGAILDPSSYLFFTKIGQTAKVAGTAMLGEEIVKQNIDPFRDDSMVPMVAAWGYTLPFLVNKLTAKVPLNVQKNLKELDDQFIGKQTVKQNDIAVDGTFVNPNKTDPQPSGVGAEGIFKSKMTTKQKMEGETFVKSNLGVFGEEGPWTPVFRLIKQNTSLTARKMIGDLLDTPLLKLKNTKEWGFQSSGKSIETDMRMMRVGEIESHKLIKDEFEKYIARIQGSRAVPKTDLGLNLHNKLTKDTPGGFMDRMSLAQFSHEVTRARLNGFSHPIQEVSAAARHTQDKVYGPLFEKIQQLGIREMPVETELLFWKSQLDAMRKKGETFRNYTSKVDNVKTTWNISRIENQIDKLTQRLANVKKRGVNDYINIIYVKNAIEKSPEKFKEIIKGHFQRAKITINESKLNQLVKDLSNHFPFVRFEKTMGDLTERYAFNRPRYARSVRARELNLDRIAQEELLDGGFILSDIFALQKAYARQIIPDILLTQKYGDPNGLGVKYFLDGEMSGFNPGLMTINNEFNVKAQSISVTPPKNLTGKARADWIRNTLKEKRKPIFKERDKVLSDLEASIELIRGTYGLPSNPHSWTSQAMRTAKHYNALTMLTGFAAAIPDVARVVMTSGIKRGFKTQFEMFSDFLDGKTIYNMGKKEAQSFGEAVDMVTGQRAMLFADVGDMFGITSKLESGMGKLSAINFMYVNLMSRWTEMAKSMASVTIGSRIIEDSIRWTKGSLPDKWKTALSSSGIDQDMARRITVQFEKHGEKTKHNFMANTAKWEDAQAVDAFGAALNKDINITIVTPGLGDTPLFMSTELGSLLTQFKKFAIGANQRMLMRGMQEKDMDFMFGSLLLVGSGMIIDKIYTEFRFGRDYSKQSLTTKLLNGFDRSGLAGIYTDINKAIETLTDNRFGIGPMFGEDRPYGSSNRWKAGTLAGPTGGQIYNIFDILYDVGGNQYNHHSAKNVRRLIPFQNVWYLDWLFDDIQKGLH